MTFRLFVFSAVALCLVPSAAAQACTKGRFQGAAPYVAKDVHADILAGKTGFESQRAKLEGFRKNERTCIGMDTIEFAIALIDVNEAPLQQSVEALPVVMRASVPEGEKAYMMNRLIERFYAAREYPTTLSLVRLAVEKFPENEGFRQKLAVLLAFMGQNEEAREVAQGLLDEAVKKVPEGVMPFAGWVRFGLTDVSGDAEDRRAVIARLSDQLGRDAGPVLDEFADVSVFAMVMARSFDRAADGEPIAPPAPAYPEEMARLRREGTCNTYFDVSVEGVPENLVTACSDPGFTEEAARAVSEDVRFKPFVLNGQPKRLVSVTYPLAFKQD
ncbi:MAG: energy transducer TonB [Hyphomonas sp.]